MADVLSLRISAARLRTRAIDLIRMADDEDNHPPTGDDMTPQQLGLKQNPDGSDTWGVELLETLDFTTNVATHKWYSLHDAITFTHQELKMRRLREEL